MSSDEIDIEEHDVLDDPRLRHLLPDLARVKTETPDYEEGAASHHAAYGPFATAVQHSSTFRHMVSPGHDDSAEYTRHNNKIILGSKPDSQHVAESVFDSNITVKQEIPDNYDETSHDSVYILGGEPNNDTDIDTHAKESHSLLGNENRMVNIQNVDFFQDEKKVFDEKIPENAHVALEDWGPKLLNSPCYCRLCKILFSTRNTLDAHKMASHSFLVAVENRDNKAYKSTTKNVENLKSCAQCNKKFASDSLLLAHVYGHLASQLNKKSSPQQSQIQNKFANKFSFGSKPSSDVSMPEEEDESSDDGVSGFYQCSVCSYYAVSKSKFLAHNNRNHFLSNPDMQRVDYNYKCSYCTYRNKDVSMYNAHILSRHNNLYTKKIEKLNINIQPNITEDTCKYQCSKCKVILPSYFLARNHRKAKHPEIKGKNLIIKIAVKPKQPKVSKLSAPLKRQRAVDMYANTSSSNPKKPKLDKLSNKKFTMHYCSACKNVYLGHRHLALHMEGKCCPQLMKKRALCRTCGLAVSSSKHKEFHETNPSATIHDIKFVRIQDNETIDAPIPPYFSCNVCKVRALRAVDLQSHDCDIAYDVCRFCNKSFLDTAYATHLEFHKYDKDISVVETAKDSELPEILKHYEMLTETWNILYLCSVCNIVTDSYDKAVEHSQNHFNNMESYGVTVKKCHICKLMFDEPCLDRHLEIHNQNSKSTKDSFKILTYDYTKLLTKEWLELFGSLPNSQIQKIVSRSIYAHSRSLKMSVFLEGAPELTLYQCHECKLYVYPPTVGKHSDLECMRSDKKFYCDICFIPFSTARGKDAHLVTHQNRGTYRHVVFNATEYKDFDMALKTDKDKIPQKIVTELENTYKENKGKSTNVILGRHFKGKSCFYMYCCIKCQGNVAQRDYARKHVCGKMKNKTYICNQCGLRISHRSKLYHIKRHKLYKTFSRDTVKVIKFEVKKNAEGMKSIVFYKNTKDANETLVKLIRCSCGLHFITSKAYDDHKSICTPKLKPTKCTCSKCGYLFDTNELFRHNCKHHSSDKLLKFVVVQSEDEESDENEHNDDGNVEEYREQMEESQKHKLYKCGSCKLFFHFKDDIVRHLPTCDPNDKKENKCSRCDIPFHLNTIKHALTVPNCEELIENDYDISTLYPREMATTSEKIDRNRCLWKCWKCDLHWASEDSLRRYHYKIANHHTSFPVVKCKQCGLNFTSKAIKLHVLKHHMNLKLKRQDLHIVTIPEDRDKMAEWRSEQYMKPLPVPKKQSLLWNMLNEKVSSKKNVTSRLRKCQACQLSFLSKSTYHAHKTSGACGKAKGVKCDICGLSFTPKTLANHIKFHHDNFHLKRGESTVAQYKETQTSTKNKVVTKTQGKNKKSPVDLYSCYKCRLIFLSKASLSRHIKLNNHEGPRITCTACGLTINSQTFYKHRDLHHKTMKLSRKDFRLKTIIPRHIKNTIRYENDEISIKDHDVDVPPETEHDNTLNKSNVDDNRRRVYKCPDCPLHFMLKKSRQAHKDLSCGKESEHDKTGRCGICKLLFTKKSLNNHMNIHHKVMRLRREDVIIESDEKTESEPKAKNTPIKSSVPFTLTKQAKAQIDLSQYDNRLWKCNDCGKHYLNVTTRNTHQIHPTNPNRSCKKTPIVNCSICGLAFTNVSLAKHEYIQHEKMNLQIEDFVIIDDKNEYHVAPTHQQHTEVLTRKYALSDKIKSQLDITQYNNQIYYCKGCGLHFMKSSSKQMHVCNASDPVDTEDCSVCGLKFYASTLPKHEYVHHERLNLQLENLEILENDDPPAKTLKTYSSTSKEYSLSEKTKAGIDMKLYNNQLFKCERCGRHLLTKASRRGHETRCLNKLMNPADIRVCSTCGLTFSAVTMLWHEYIHHDNMKLQLEDFEIVEDEKIPDATPAEIDESEIPDESKTYKYSMSRKMKKQIDISRYSSSIYKCKCGLHFLTPNARRTHEPKCYDGTLDPEHSQKTECSICGLEFSPVTLAKHEYIHHETLNLYRDDLYVVTATSYVHRQTDETMKENPKKEAKPKKEARKSDIQIDDMSKYNNQLYKCTVCEKHFLTSRGIANHSFYCDVSSRSVGNCPECGLTFSSTTLPKHIVIHHENLKLKLQDFEIIEKSNDTVEESNNTVEESNDTVEESNDSVENSNETVVKVSERPSRSLRSRLTRSFYADDSEGSLNTSRASSVQNLTVDSSMFESNENEEPDRAATPISTRLAAEYKDNKRVKGVTADALKALDFSIYNNELFKCSTCNIVMMLRKSMIKHIDSNAHVPARRQVNCDRCDGTFSSMALVRHIYVHHEKMNLKKEDLKMISGEELQRTLYKCMKCDTHYFEERSLITHPCGRLHPKCIICDLKFGHLGTLNIHYEKHHKKLKLSVDDMIIITIDLSKNSGTSNLKESEEPLGNIKQEIETLVDEMEVSQDDDQISQTSENILQDLSPRIVEIASVNSVVQIPLTADETPKKLETHTGEPKTHSMTPKNNSVSEIDAQLSDEPPALELSTLDISLYDNKLFKCIQCSLHFLAMENFKWHIDNSDHKSVRKIHCTICGLAFSARTLPTHTFIHHEKLKLGADDFKVTYGMVSEAGPSNPELNANDSVVTQSSDESITEEQSPAKKSNPKPINITSSDEIVTTKKYTTKLYKCSECNVHFLSQAACYKHTHVHEPFDPFDYIACKICGLQFGNMTFPKHVIMHHKNKEFHLDQVLVEAYQPSKEHGMPKVEIYLAIDKVQSKLVSTTTEKDTPVCSTSEDKISENIPESTSSVDESESQSRSSQDVPKTTGLVAEKSIDIPESASIVPVSEAELVTEREKSSELSSANEDEKLSRGIPDSDKPESISETEDMEIDEMCTLTMTIQKDIPEHGSSVAKPAHELLTEDVKLSRDTSELDAVLPSELRITGDYTNSQDILESAIVKSNVNKNTESDLMMEDKFSSHRIAESTKPDPSYIVGPDTELMTEVVKNSQDIPVSVSEADPESSLVTEGENTSQCIPESISNSPQNIPESTNSVVKPDLESNLVTEGENTSQDIPQSTNSVAEADPEAILVMESGNTSQSPQNIPETTNSLAEPDPESSLVTKDENTSQDIPESISNRTQDIPEFSKSVVKPYHESNLLTEGENTSQHIPQSTNSVSEADPGASVVTEGENTSRDIPESIRNSTQNIPDPLISVVKPDLESNLVTKGESTSQYIPQSTNSVAEGDPEASLVTEGGNTSQSPQNIPETTKSVVEPYHESNLVTEGENTSQHIPQSTNSVAEADPEASLVTEGENTSRDIPECIRNSPQNIPESTNSVVEPDPESNLVTEGEYTSKNIPQSTNSVAEADPESSLVTEGENTSQDIPESIRNSPQNIPESTNSVVEPDPESNLVTEGEYTSKNIPQSTNSVAEADPEASLVTEGENTSQDIPESIRNSPQNITESTKSVVQPDLELNLATEGENTSQDIPMNIETI